MHRSERRMRRPRPCVALCEPRQHGIGRGHRIVDEQRKRDDQRAERYALHIDTCQLHDREHDHQRQRNRQRNHQPGPHAEADEADHKDDGDRLPQRCHEFGDRVFDRHRLIGHQLRLDADRQVGWSPSSGHSECCWPKARMSPPSRIAIASPIAGSPLTRNSGCGGSAIGAADLRRCR